MTTFKEAQRVQSQKAARSKRFNRVPTEDQEQMTLMSWAHRVKYGSGRLSDYLFHIPNGGSRNILEAAKFKKLGVKAGVPDLQLIVPNGEIHGLWIELKSKKGKLQPSQRLMIQRLEEQGYMCKVCFGADEAIDEIKKYLMIQGDGMKSKVDVDALKLTLQWQGFFLKGWFEDHWCDLKDYAEASLKLLLIILRILFSPILIIYVIWQTRKMYEQIASGEVNREKVRNHIKKYGK